MKLLKMRIDGALLFEDNRLELDFLATDRVPRDEEGNVVDVTPVADGSSIYTQNVMGIVGVNASGKTTALNLVRLVLGYLSGSYIMRSFEQTSDQFGKLANRIAISCIFSEKGNCYLIESRLRHLSGLSDGVRLGDRRSSDAFAFEDEVLWKVPVSRVTRKAIVDIDLFKQHAELFMRRNGEEGDDRTLDKAHRTFLGDDMSIVSIVTGMRGMPVESLERTLPLVSLPTPVVQAFDASVEYLKWDVENQVFHLKFKNESSERVLGAAAAAMVLSNGTIMGAELVERAIAALKSGGYLIVDEMETGLNRSLVGTVIELFASPATNPKGASLLFSTHYPELLDVMRRKDNLYVLVRNAEYKTEVVKYSTQVKRIENKKSDVVINNVIKGSMPKYPDVQAMRDYVCERVNG